MSDGVEIAVQIRARDTETVEDLPTYFTAEQSVSGPELEQFDAEKVVDETMKTAVREAVAEWAEEYDHE
jgi:hypothetical protein